MDFVVATIPTMLALEESARLVAALRAEDVPVGTMVVNQVVGEGMGGRYLGMKLKEQAAALRLLEGSPNLAPLEVVRGKQLDMEVCGLPALQYVAGAVWSGVPLPAAGAGEGIVRSSAPPFLCSAGRGGLHEWPSVSRPRFCRSCCAAEWAPGLCFVEISVLCMMYTRRTACCRGWWIPQSAVVQITAFPVCFLGVARRSHAYIQAAAKG